MFLWGFFVVVVFCMFYFAMNHPLSCSDFYYGVFSPIARKHGRWQFHVQKLTSSEPFVLLPRTGWEWKCDLILAKQAVFWRHLNPHFLIKSTMFRVIHRAGRGRSDCGTNQHILATRRCNPFSFPVLYVLRVTGCFPVPSLVCQVHERSVTFQ